MPAFHRRFAVWSILFFLVPWALAWFEHLYTLAIVLTGVISFSLLNHLRKRKISVTLDTIYAWTLMVFNLVLCGLGNFSLPFFPFVLALVPIALFFYFQRSRENSDWNHGLWHLFSAAISVFAQLTYLTK
jgi:hypothetical protein